MKMSKTLLAVVGLTAALASCTDADIASQNISKAADSFGVVRRVVFLNGITDRYILSIEGKCSIKKDNSDNQLEVTCKTAPDKYKKHFLGISDNVTYFAEQMDEISVSAYHYKVIFKPQAILPDIDFSGNTGELTTSIPPITDLDFTTSTKDAN
jgi:hypothetical protein